MALHGIAAYIAQGPVRSACNMRFFDLQYEPKKLKTKINKYLYSF